MTPLPKGPVDPACVLARLRSSHEEIQSLRRELAAAEGTSLAAAEQIVEVGVKALRRTGERVQLLFRRLAMKRDAETQAYRAFQIDHGIEREATCPDIQSTVMVTQGAVLAEAAVTAGLLVSDGKLAPVEACIYGLSFAGINVAVGLAAGYFGCRFAGYRVNAPDARPRDEHVRLAAWAGLGASAGALTLLNLAAARTRATGSHKDIWNFEKVSFLGTFDDYFAIAILILGALGAVLAVYKGWTGIKDPVPGYTEARQAAEDDILYAAEELRAQFEDATETQFEDAFDALEPEIERFEEDRETLRTGWLELASLVSAHNHTVEAARDAARRQAEADQVRESFIARPRERATVSGFDDSAFTALLIPEAPLSTFENADAGEPALIAALRAVLASAHADAAAAVLDAHTAFLTDSAPFDPSIDTTGKGA
ncbi:MAG: hypothetical protein GC191_13045 [Azospirillum sp.]|nr:hypothetical protein [Azospirillum sp.]